MSNPNQFQYADWITMESMRQLLNRLVVAQYANTSHNKEFKKAFPIGETLRVRFPQRYKVRDGLGYDPQALQNRSTDVTVNQIFGIDFEWDDFQKAMQMGRSEEEIKSQYIAPAMSKLAQEIDSRFALYAYQNTPNITGALGTNPTTLDSISGAARQQMIQNAGWVGAGEKGMIVTPSVERAMVAAGVQYFNPTSEISRQYKEGSMGTQGGFEWFSSMSLYKHTAGTLTTPTVSGSGQSGSSLLIACTAGNTVNKGDVISIANVLPVNPETLRTSSTDAKTFTITATQTAVGSTMTVQIYPEIIGPGDPYQNVDALPVTGATITLFPGTNTPNGKAGFNGLAFSKDAFALVGIELEVPENEQIASQKRDKETGIAIRFVRSWDPIQSRMINRFDCVLGFGTLYAENCSVRILGA